MCDTTIGVLISYTLLKIFDNIANRKEWSVAKSGNYIVEDQVDLAAWAI